jgi:hypothetical protein
MKKGSSHRRLRPAPAYTLPGQVPAGMTDFDVSVSFQEPVNVPIPGLIIEPGMLYMEK